MIRGGSNNYFGLTSKQNKFPSAPSAGDNPAFGSASSWRTNNRPPARAGSPNIRFMRFACGTRAVTETPSSRRWAIQRPWLFVTIKALSATTIEALVESGRFSPGLTGLKASLLQSSLPEATSRHWNSPTVSPRYGRVTSYSRVKPGK